MIKLRIAIFLAILFFGIWHNIESDIRTACNGNQACLDASL